MLNNRYEIFFQPRATWFFSISNKKTPRFSPFLPRDLPSSLRTRQKNIHPPKNFHAPPPTPPNPFRLFLMVHPLGLTPRDLCFSGYVVRAKILNVLGSRTKERHIALFRIKANAWVLPDCLGLSRPSDSSPNALSEKAWEGTVHTLFERSRHWLDTTRHHEIKHLTVRREYSTVQYFL